MGRTKRYYWLKMPEDFFTQSPYVKVISDGKDGDHYIAAYMKMLALSIKDRGRLRLDDRIPYTYATLAATIGTQEKYVAGCIERGMKCGAIQLLKDGTILLPMLEGMIGSETDAAARMRNMRDRNTGEHCYADVTTDRDLDNIDDDEEDREGTEREGTIPKELETLITTLQHERELQASMDQDVAAGVHGAIPYCPPARREEACEVWRRVYGRIKPVQREVIHRLANFFDPSMIEAAIEEAAGRDLTSPLAWIGTTLNDWAISGCKSRGDVEQLLADRAMKRRGAR